MSKNSDKYKAPGTPKPKPEAKKTSVDEDFLEISVSYFPEENSSAPSLRIAMPRSASFHEEDWEEAEAIHRSSPVIPENATSSDLAHSDISIAFSGEGSSA